jgi:energy-coupling factor transporter ATP-binding protein EcfA2
VDRFVVISGSSGGGKSTLLVELSRCGYAVAEESGRRIVKEGLKDSESAFPGWTKPPSRVKALKWLLRAESCGPIHTPCSRAPTGRLGLQLTDTMVEHRSLAPSVAKGQRGATFDVRAGVVLRNRNQWQPSFPSP